MEARRSFDLWGSLGTKKFHFLKSEASSEMILPFFL